MARKRGKLSTEEEQFIRENADTLSIEQIAVQLNRTERTVTEYCNKNRLTYKGMSEEKFDDTVLRQKLMERPYWATVQDQFSDTELEYFCVTWVRIVKQFREDILYTEELQAKQWITLEILLNRVMKERKRAIEQIDRLQDMLDREYDQDEDIRDNARIAALETELSMIRNSLSTYTSEHAKILDKIKDIQKEMKATRDQRVKKVEDSKSSWAGFMRALEDEDMRKLVGDDIGIMKLAKDQARTDFSEYHNYEDGQVDRPILTVATAKED